MDEYITYEQAWLDFKGKSLDERMECYGKNENIFDVLFSKQFNRPFLDHIYKVTNKIRIISKTKEGSKFLENLLRDKRAMLYFVQPSTRTFLSFLNACYIMGLKPCDIRDTSTSSEVKGESPLDTIRTFSSYVDVIIMRHPEKDFAEKSAWYLNNTDRPVPIVNGGSGKDQHPTQALLDIYTLMRSFEKNGGVDGKTIAMVGDLKRGRTVRSLSYLLKNFKNVKITYISPEKFKMEEDILSFLKKHNISFKETEDFKGGIKDADAIYMTRIQDEHDKDKGESKSHYEDFAIGREHLSIIKPHAVIMHPLPRRLEIDIEVDKDPRAKYWRQERNGMWSRAALLSQIFKVDNDILSY